MKTAVGPVLGFENRAKKSPANKPIRRMSRRTLRNDNQAPADASAATTVSRKSWKIAPRLVSGALWATSQISIFFNMPEAPHTTSISSASVKSRWTLSTG